MITAKQVQELREKTGAGMMDCKKALVAADGDMAKAIENLRKSGAAKAEKKSGRSTNEGKVWTAIGDGKAAIIELCCETDFAANTPKFAELVKRLAADALAFDGEGDITEGLKAADAQVISDAIGVISENMQLRRAARFVAAGNSFASYHHGNGRVSVLVEAEGAADAELLKAVCMHVAAFNPTYIDKDDVPAEVIAKEKEIALAADPKLAAKPANMQEKILIGKMGRFYSENCLRQQAWVQDDKTTLEKLNPALKVKRIIRWAVGEEL